MSDAHERFLTSLRNDQDWPDDLDYAAYEACTPDEKRALAELLVAQAEATEDSRVIAFLPVVLDAPTLCATLARLVGQKTGRARLRAAEALANAPKRLAVAALRSLVNDASEPWRDTAVALLGEVGGRDELEWLAKHAPDHAVFERAVDQLWVDNRLPWWTPDPWQGLGVLQRRLHQPFPSVREPAFAELLTILRTGPAAHGYSPAKRDYSEAFKDFLKSVYDAAATIRIELLPQLGDDERRSAELYLVERVHGAKDARAATALADAGLRQHRDVLEWAERQGGALGPAAHAALARLASPPS